MKKAKKRVKSKAKPKARMKARVKAAMKAGAVDLKRLLKSNQPAIKRALKKATEVAAILKEDAKIGAKYGQLKLKELDIERQRAAKIYAIGKRAMVLCQGGKLRDGMIASSCRRIAALEKTAKKYNEAAKKVGGRIKFRKARRK